MESLHQGLAVVRTKDFPKLHQLHQMLAIKEAGGSNFPSIYGAVKEFQRNRANGKTSNAVEGEGQREAQDTDNEDSGEKNNQENLEQEEEEDRWFFRKWYRSDCKQFEQPPLPAQRLSHSVPPLYKTVQKLRCLDIFAGCGGLSLGLDQSGVANTNWAIEKKKEAAEAFKLNNPDCVVFTEDCNDFLRAAKSGMAENSEGQRFPVKGEVDLLCGAPPCQGFSILNRKEDKESANLISTFLSFAEFYRPRFIIMENVKNMAYANEGAVLSQSVPPLGIIAGYGGLSLGLDQSGVANTNWAIEMKKKAAEVFKLNNPNCTVFTE